MSCCICGLFARRDRNISGLPIIFCMIGLSIIWRIISGLLIICWAIAWKIDSVHAKWKTDLCDVHCPLSSIKSYNTSPATHLRASSRHLSTKQRINNGCPTSSLQENTILCDTNICAAKRKTTQTLHFSIHLRSWLMRVEMHCETTVSSCRCDTGSVQTEVKTPTKL